MIALIPLLLATAAVPTEAPAARRGAQVTATASVTIIRAEPVSVQKEASAPAPTDRQYRRRDAMPLVEFF
jgi:hypothetical protein